MSSPVPSVPRVVTKLYHCSSFSYHISSNSLPTTKQMSPTGPYLIQEMTGERLMSGVWYYILDRHLSWAWHAANSSYILMHNSIWGRSCSACEGEEVTNSVYRVSLDISNMSLSIQCLYLDTVLITQSHLIIIKDQHIYFVRHSSTSIPVFFPC